jgi:uncharacterized protein
MGLPRKGRGHQGSPGLHHVSSDDGLAPANEAFAKALVQAGDRKVTTHHLPTDHAYSDQRTELSRDVLKWLATLK